ncbi:ABC-type bacteriocin/lantibiotic exporter, contains an N-terminal double-glycine peptidase domain [Butyrivibrio fibrisolvens]|uniref:ABC-type bacteriocin/lantibiotic exporter, contains an N-terminal double-glycine peptidase domain n=1 Tax=Butyrivibrio fibrisolvens TaxID=831 RepID=A0A1H9Q3G4_BUTFI|nr:ABC transporter ATP-binding protein [Butyrivibrio fibrisolvens]SER55007.1 ABC-type bacteriocin/lantibiotic exporter, contains an N-terminal double-glycine peptidase domain [Butyrivibrio fibrisolvens]
MKKNILLFKQIIDEIRYVLEDKQKRRLVYVFLTIVISSGLELLGVTAILPFVQAVVSPDQLFENAIIQKVCSMLGIKDNTGLLIAIGVALIVVYLVKNAYIIYSTYVQTDFLTSMQKQLSVRMLDSYLSRPYTYFLDTNSSVIRTGCLSSIVSFRDTIGALLTLATELLTTVLIGIYLIYTDWFTALGTILLITCILFAILILFKPAVKKSGKEAKASDVERNKSISQAVEGVKDIFVTKRKAYFVDSFCNAAERARVATRTYTVLSGCPNRITEAVCVSGIIGIVCIRLALGDENMVSFVPKLASFAMAAFKVLPSVGKIANCITSIVYNRPFEEEVYKNVHEAEKYNDRFKDKNIKLGSYDQIEFDKPNDEMACKIGRSDFEINLDNIEWKYSNQEKPVLHNLSLNIKKGESIGFIGSSGSGKTTVSDILLGLLKPQAGSVTIADKDIFDMPYVWAKLVGYVPQSIYLIDDTIRANVAFGMKDVSDDKIWEALDKASLKDFVEKLPDKLDTIVGERGIKFSGGQRQRVAIARALYYEPEILILDEATAALDNETENAVLESIESLQGSVTLIIVAHRLTTIRNCDKIYEIKDGKAFEKDKKMVMSQV